MANRDYNIWNYALYFIGIFLDKWQCQIDFSKLYPIDVEDDINRQFRVWQTDMTIYEIMIYLIRYFAMSNRL